ncbi:restriction endonuclease [Kineococcus sp. SYSU DK006]|uniref:restriction endonuclease n=1 Tax=Kineococcus sp. SYSU DK006 TaxID=3383127 RepID=UPI003D7DD229
MARKKSAGGADDAARFAAALVIVLVMSGAAAVVRSWLAIWWPLLALAAAVLVVLALWRVVVLRRRSRARVARQAELDRQVASTDGMSGSDFEQLVARLLRRDGWREVVVSGGAGDLGADVRARHPRDGSLLVVQCKRYSNRAVSSPDMQRFLGTVFHHHRAEHALYVATSFYSRPARALAASSGVHLVDRQALAAWMAGQPLTLTTTSAGASVVPR